MNATCAISHLCARSPPPNFSIRSNKFEKVERDNLLLFVITIWQSSHVKLTRNPQDYYPCYFSIFSLAKQIRETNSFQPSSPIRSGIFQDIVSPFNLPAYYFLENQPDLKERNSIVYQYVLSRLSSRAHWKPSYTQLKYEDSWTNSFIFLPRLLSIEPGIIADRNHRERERQVFMYIRVCRVFRISEWSSPIPYSAPIKNESKISLHLRLVECTNARECHVTASFTILTARSPCQKQPCKADTTSSASYPRT